MFTRYFATSIAAVALVLLGAGVWSGDSIVDDDQREKLWQQVDEAQKKSLPKSAAELLDQIHQSALADGEYPEAVRAIATKYTMLGRINQPADVYAIKQLQNDLDAFPDEIRPVMQAILAHWFYNYYQRNRWSFARRTQTAAPPSDDFQTWDLPRLLNEIDRLFTESLANAERLQGIPIARYEKLLKQGDFDDSHRPTLFDFIAFEALDFYSIDEQVVRKQGAFEVTADSPVFAGVEQFLDWEVKTEDDDSFLLNAVRLYQTVLKFHQNDTDKTALIDADFHRLNFGRKVSVGAEKNARYRAAVNRLVEQNDEHPISARALYSLASLENGEGDFSKAHEIAGRGMAGFPDSVGGKQCFNLIQQIEAKSLNVFTERVWNGSEAVIELRYRNLTEVHFRLLKFDFENWNWGQYRRPERAGRNLDVINGKAIVKQWQAELPATDDFKFRVESLKTKFELESGCYLLVASIDDKFSADSQLVSATEVWASSIAVVDRKNYDNGEISGQVFDAETGKPLAGADVSISSWQRDGRNSRSKPLANIKTDENGIYRVQGVLRAQHRVLIRSGDQSFGFVDGHTSYRNQSNDRLNNQTVFFTDRSIYRPGQTIKFKGVCYLSDHEQNDYKTLPNRSLQVSLRDVNNEIVEQRRFTTNEFGSFSGSFTAPRGRATGRMRLHVEQGPTGSSGFRVEEYKRPKFIVDIDKPTQQYKLNDSVELSGNAKSYTGAAIDSAKVVWRVVREVRLPYWWYWRHRGISSGRGQTREIASGESTTGVDGVFAISFDALPDLSVDAESEPVFVYSIYADVTDSTGETRSDRQTIQLGYTSLQANLECGAWQTAASPVEVKITTSTLDAEGVAAEGTLKLYRLKAPAQIARAQLGKPIDSVDLSKTTAWSLGELVVERPVVTNDEGVSDQKFELAAGAYKAVFETRDKAGRKVTGERPIDVVDLESEKLAIKVPHFFRTKKDTVEVGEEFVAVWGTGYDDGRAYVELEHRGKVFKSFWTGENSTQAVVKMQVPEKMRGGFTIHVTYVRQNRAYLETKRISVPWSNKKLQVKWERFVSKLQPGGKVSWTAVVSGDDAAGQVAEMVAGMYDASLDAYSPHSWNSSIGAFYSDFSRTNFSFLNQTQYFRTLQNRLSTIRKPVSSRYRYFDSGILPMSRFRSRQGKIRSLSGVAQGSAPSAMAIDELGLAENADGEAPARSAGQSFAAKSAEAEAEPDVDLSKVTARKNLNETAFFFPALRVDDQGRVRIEFEVPEALTSWKFMGFAHDNDLRSALLTDEVVTFKDLMVQPNPPRFLREGDELEFSVKITNQSAAAQTGKVRLSFANAQDDSSMDAQLGNAENEKTFEVPAGQSKSVYWKLSVPDFVGVLTYKVVGATEQLSDGEEGYLPVLSKRILVTESLPLPIRGNQTREFEFDRLKLAESSDSLVSQSYTVQMASNPSWYAVMALPYLMEYPHGCSEQVFNRLYANALGGHIVNSNPRIQRIFDQWRGTDALDSPLEKNEDLRNVLIAESPWLRAAKKESQSRRDVAVLFDKNRLNAETRRSLEQIKQMQYSDGSWPWFPGGRANDYITLYVTTGFGRLRHLGVEVDVSPAKKSLDRLDNWIRQTYEKIDEDKRDGNHLSPTICMYLYGRSFFLQDQQIDAKYKEAVDYFLGQAKQYWPDLGGRLSQGHLAIGLKRFGDAQTPLAIMKSLTERSQNDDELGMYWQEERSWWWHRAPIETQALMIEAFEEVLADAEKVEECKIWLLKQKQTQNWKTTKATADAVYALLIRGADKLASNQIVEVKLGGAAVVPEAVEAGTGFFEKRFAASEIKPEMGQITVAKRDAGIAWGSVHWQYLEDVGKVKPYEGTPLTLKKGLFVKKNSPRGPVIEPVSGAVEVGDELVTRVEIRVDRDMEYVHLKDYRGSGTEPVNVLSRYKFQDGLAYYESTKDTASHFFIDYLPRGTYVFEYSVRVQHRGVYETGIAELQCMYAPEFNSHSASVKIEVQ